MFFWGSGGVPHSLWNLSSLTSDRIQATAVKALSPNHWTASGILKKVHFKFISNKSFQNFQDQL